MAIPESSVAEAMQKMSSTGKSADMRSRRLLDIGQVVSVRIERGQAGERPGFLATVRMPYHWTANDGRIRWGLIPDVYMSAPVAIGDMVVLETIGRGFAAVYIGSPAVQPMALHVSGEVFLPSLQLEAQGPGGAVQWYRRLGTFSMRGQSSAFTASAHFVELRQTAPALTSRLPATVPLDYNTSTADLSALNTVLESGLIYDNTVPFTVRLAALGPYDEDGNRVRPTGADAAWVLGEGGAGRAGAVVNPGHVAIADNPGLTISFDAAFDVGAADGERCSTCTCWSPSPSAPGLRPTRPSA